MALLLYFAFSLLGGLSTLAAPLTRRVVDNTQPSGANPIKFSNVEWLGVQTSANSCSHRDLGFTGKLGGDWYAVYGDTTWCANGVTDPTKDNGGFNGMVRDAVSKMTPNVLKTEDMNLNTDSPVGHQHQFIPFNTAWGEDQSYGFGGTSICATNDTIPEGAVYYVVNANIAGLKGAGIAKVNIVNGSPQVTQRFGDNGVWWPASSSPRYGDIASYRDEKSDYIYAIGGPPSTQTGYVDEGYVFQARVKAVDAFDLSKYEYWHGRSVGWSTNPLTSFTPETAVMWNAGQGQLVWNDYYETYIFVHTVPGGTQVALRTAPKPEGPWSQDTIVFDANIPLGNLMYAGVAHPYLDPSGKTLTITYTNYPTDIQAIKVIFQ